MKAAYIYSKIYDEIDEQELKKELFKIYGPQNEIENLFFSNCNRILDLEEATKSAILFSDREIFEKNIYYSLKVDTVNINTKFLYNNNLKQTYLLDIYKYYGSIETLEINIKTFMLFQKIEKEWKMSILDFKSDNIRNAVDYYLFRCTDREMIRTGFFRILNFFQWIYSKKLSTGNENLLVDAWLSFDYSKKNF